VMKKEARIARVEGLPGGSILVIVFRGGWIDGLSAFPGIAGRGGVAEWLDGSRYLEELRGISMGEGLGVAEAAEVSGWAKTKGLPEVVIGERNRRQARVIAEGFRQLLQGKG
jgi:hypothetical protein